MDNYTKSKGDVYLRALLLGGGLLQLSSALFNKNAFVYLGKHGPRVGALVIGLCALFLIRRDYFLPFLGQSVFPMHALNSKQIPYGANVSKQVRVQPNAKVVYWAAEPCSRESQCTPPVGVWEAYGEYRNAGVTTADKEGNATLKVRSPQSYVVPNKGGAISPHIHYRYFLNEGMLSDVHTVSL